VVRNAPATLAGRDGAIDALLAATGSGTPPVVVLSGRAGSGRTAVLDAIRARLRDQRVPTTWITATRGDASSDLGLLERMCMALADGSDLTRLLAAFHTGATSLDRLAAVFGDVLLARGRHVLLVDDAQWADPVTLALVAPLARRLKGGDVRLICAVRDPAPGHQATRLVRDRLVSAVRLGPLGVSACAAMVADALGARPSHALMTELRRLGEGAPGPMLAAVSGYRVAGGLWITDGNAYLVDPGVPPALPLTDPLFGDFTRLPAKTREILTTAAGLHRVGPSARDLIAECADSTQEEVCAAFAQAQARGMLTSLASASPDFRPPLLGRALTGHLGPYLTQRIAEAVVRRAWDGALPAAPPEYLNDQVAVAGALVDKSRAATILLRQGRSSVDTRPVETRRWLTAAARLCDGDDRMEALLKLSIACWQLGDWRTAIDTIDRLIEEYGDRLSIRAMQEAQLMRIKCLRAVKDHKALEDTVASTSHTLGNGGPALQHVTAGVALHSLGRHQETINHLELTENTWRTVGGVTGRVGHFSLNASRFMIGRIDARTYAETYDTWPDSDNMAPYEVSARVHAVIDLLLAADDLTGALSVLAKAGRTPDSLEGATKAVLCFLSGDWGLNLDIARDQMAMGLASAPMVDQDVVWRSLARVNLARAKPFGAKALLDTMRYPQSAERHLLRTVQSDVERLLGDQEKAVSLLRLGIQEAQQSEVILGTDQLWLRRADLAATDEPAVVRQCVDATARIADLVGTDSARLNHLVTRFIAERDAGPAEEAMRMAVRMNQPFTLAETITRLARFGGGTDRQLRRAYDIYFELGAYLPRTTVRRIMRERGLSVPGRQATMAEQQFVLATLVTEGLSNREAALLLQDTEKSVEGRLSRLFKQTGFRSRVELAAAVLTGTFAVDSLV
jgi:DNA-binding NarL/FixJ family response regulator